MSKKSGRRALPIRPPLGGNKGGAAKIAGGSKASQLQKLQEEFAQAQEQLKAKTATATAGGGVVQVTVNGSQEVVELKLAPEVVDPEDVEMLQDLILVAVNEALEKSRALAAEQFSGLTGGLGLGGMF
jgi:DNA-binding YbaB/EbfC family protein